MKMVLKLQNHYNFSFEEKTNSYIFETKNKITYKIIFVNDFTFNTISVSESFNDVYQIVIEKISKEIEPFDSLVSKTISEIILCFFKNNNNSILYVCSDNDKKEIKRFNAFQRWYAQSETNKFILKIDNILSFEYENSKQLIFTSFLIHSENPRKNDLIEIYSQIENSINSEK